MKYTWFVTAQPFYTFYEGDDSAATADDSTGGGDDANDGGGGDGGDDGGDDDGTSGNDAGDDKSITQAELNRVLKRERKKFESRTKNTIRELEELKKSKTMTEQDRAKLETRIEALQDELLTKQQLTVKEKEKLKKAHEEALNTVTKERDTWQQRFTQSEIARSIFDAAASEGAFQPADIKAHLQPNTQLVEELDDDGQGTGRFIPRVKFADKDKDNKPITLDLTVDEAVKRMKETPESFGHLFKSTAKSGFGGSGGAGRGTAQDIKKMSPEEYRVFRKTNIG